VNAFVVKLNAAGTGLVYSTYLGGSVADFASGIAVDGPGTPRKMQLIRVQREVSKNSQ
jgi:hypothetical protein